MAKRYRMSSGQSRRAWNKSAGKVHRSNKRFSFKYGDRRR